jgi:2-hydroxychromene-2-carboxylate isomerase/glutaredoxin
MTRRWTPALGAIAAMGLLFGCQDLKPIKGKGRVAAPGATAAVARGTGSIGKSGTTGNKAKIELYIMSKCPFGVRAVDAFTPVLKAMGDRMDFNLHYIADKVPAGKKCRRNKEPYKGFCALHGKPEVIGNIQQLCVMKHYPQLAQWLPFVECQNKTWRNIPNNWEGCAKQANLDVAKLKGCIDGAEGLQLHTASSNKAKARRASGSPTIYVGGKSYRGGRSKNDLMRAVCQQLSGDKPKPCTNIPEPVEVKAIVLTDKRCTKCNTAGLQANLRGRFFPKLSVRTVDYSTPEGKKLYAQFKLKMLPVWLFEKSVTKAEKFARIKRWMIPAGEYFKLRVPARFDPTAEICDNKKDDTGNGKVDCDDDSCKGKLVCREEKKKQVDVFVMSQCPFGVKALDAMKEVLKNFGSAIKFDVHYIADEVPAGKKCRRNKDPHKGFCALHGKSEVDENMRQLCAKKYYRAGNKYLDYIWCRNKNYRSNEWKGCAKEAGLDAAKIEKCAEGPEGIKLHSASSKIAKTLGVSGSPTWLANNRFKFSGIAANAIKQNICTRNKDLTNCDKKLSTGKKVSGSCGG